MKISAATAQILKEYPVLVFEELHPEHFDDVKLGALSVEGLAHPDRIRFVKKWHVIFAAPGQVYATKNAHKVCCCVLFLSFHLYFCSFFSSICFSWLVLFLLSLFLFFFLSFFPSFFLSFFLSFSLSVSSFQVESSSAAFSSAESFCSCKFVPFYCMVQLIVLSGLVWSFPFSFAMVLFIVGCFLLDCLIAG